MTAPNQIAADLQWHVARALSIPEHHTTWDLLTEREKDLYFQQARYALHIFKDVLKAGDHLSVCAQTTGGTAGRDDGLVAAIDGWAKARASLLRVAEGESAAIAQNPSQDPFHD